MRKSGWDGLMPARFKIRASGSPPKCVGTAVPYIGGFINLTVHPHVRGDGGSTSLPSATAPGSPPRAWGRLAISYRPSALEREREVELVAPVG